MNYSENIRAIAAFLHRDGRKKGIRGEHQATFDGLVKGLGKYLAGFNRQFLYDLCPEGGMHVCERKKANTLARQSRFLTPVKSKDTRYQEFRITKIPRDFEAVGRFKEAGIPQVSFEWEPSESRTVQEILSSYNI